MRNELDAFFEDFPEDEDNKYETRAGTFVNKNKFDARQKAAQEDADKAPPYLKVYKDHGPLITDTTLGAIRIKKYADGFEQRWVAGIRV